MYPILLIMFVGLGMAVERLLFLARVKKSNKELWDEVFPSSKKSNKEEIWSIVTGPCVSSSIIKVGPLSQLPKQQIGSKVKRLSAVV